jgi:hypothetical protein
MKLTSRLRRKISFYLTLPKGEKTEETIKKFAKEGETTGWVKGMAAIRLGIEDFYFQGVGQHVDRSWAERGFPISCLIRGGSSQLLMPFKSQIREILTDVRGQKGATHLEWTTLMIEANEVLIEAAMISTYIIPKQNLKVRSLC